MPIEGCKYVSQAHLGARLVVGVLIRGVCRVSFAVHRFFLGCAILILIIYTGVSSLLQWG